LEPTDGHHAIFKTLQTPGYTSLQKITLKVHCWLQVFYSQLFV